MRLHHLHRLRRPRRLPRLHRPRTVHRMAGALERAVLGAAMNAALFVLERQLRRIKGDGSGP